MSRPASFLGELVGFPGSFYLLRTDQPTRPVGRPGVPGRV